MKELQQTKSSSVDQAKPDSEPPKCCNFNPPMLPVSGTDPAFVSMTESKRGTDSLTTLAGVDVPDREIRLRRGCGREIEDGELCTPVSSAIL